MRSGRHTDHHAQALRAAPAFAALLAVASILSGLALAGDQIEIAADGTVHSVSAGYELAVGNSNPILYVRQSPSGDSVSRILPGTEVGANFQPSVAIDPVTDFPVVVWTHVDRGDAEIYLSRFEGGAGWTDPIAIAPGRGDDVAAELRVGENLLHVFWRRETTGGDTVLLRASLDRDSLALVLGPENLPTDGIPLIWPGGGADTPSEAPDPQDSFVVEEVWGGDPESPHVLIVYGIRDEPMPVGYRQGFMLPPGMDEINDPAAAWIGNRFVLSFVWGDQLVYTILDDGEWSELRRINLDGMSAAAARTELAAMLLRSDGGAGS